MITATELNTRINALELIVMNIAKSADVQTMINIQTALGQLALEYEGENREIIKRYSATLSRK